MSCFTVSQVPRAGVEGPAALPALLLQRHLKFLSARLCTQVLCPHRGSDPRDCPSGCHSLSKSPFLSPYEAKTLQATLQVPTDSHLLREDVLTLRTGPGQRHLPSQPSADVTIVLVLCDILFVSSGQCAPSCRFSNNLAEGTGADRSLLVTEGAWPPAAAQGNPEDTAT